MSEEEVDALGQDGQGSAIRVDRDRRAPRFSWTPAYEATFFRSLCESVQLGLRENSSFKAEAWERAAQALQESHAAYPAKSHLINKSDNARKRFRLWRGLREDPDFLYNPVTRTVTATEEAWRAHIEREPLSRALRGRPFDHEDYMEVLYPDVIGSGGAPKRVMKPRRRTDGMGDESEMPGTGILNLQSETASQSAADSPDHQRPPLSQTTSSSSAASLAQLQKSVPSAGRTTPRSSSAMTPPDDVATSQTRKRPLLGSTPRDSNEDISSVALTDKAAPAASPGKRRRTSSHSASFLSGPNHGVPASSIARPPAAAILSNQHDAMLNGAQPVLEELLDAIKSRSVPRWREEALDIFFRDFADEDLDLQVKISENVLSNESKALVFCKMPVRVRQHWVKRFREAHHKPT
ncbi:Myb/SANT-like DNA-binding domain-containing protein [Stachybotrys elegans]|uniref:Myb/SANT-like DNA-binding domain-containing protein n=1 Tax=Stachybotrys elegans TaxID=80388 RepID=A0A8K0T1E0_9HYPO|nr:Myb/SANT-like DNA-binding domain-containing protein [Stachybotrys elegans]